MKILKRTLALALGAAVALCGTLAVAQQPRQPIQVAPPTGTAPQLDPSRPRPLPPTHPPIPGMEPPGGRHPGRPPMPPRTRPGKPGTASPTRLHPVAAAEEEHEHGGGEHVCPGHGPEDPPPHVNYWHGMLMVDNERAQKPDFLDQLLFRYEDPKNPCDPKNEAPPYMAALLNFSVLVYILYRFGRKPLTEALLKRKQSIMAEIDLADELYEKAEARLDDYEERIENIEAKLAEVRAEYAAQAAVEQKHLLAEAEERRVRMRRDAEFRIDQERKAVRDALLEEAVVSATAAAEALIRKQMSRADHDRMATDYLAAVGAALVTMGAPPSPRGGNEPRPLGAHT